MNENHRRTALKNSFKTGMIPAEEQYHCWIDAMINQADDGIHAQDGIVTIDTKRNLRKIG